jgi:hypothetical protein
MTRWYPAQTILVVEDKIRDTWQKKPSQSEHFSPIYSQMSTSKMYLFPFFDD